MSWPPLSTAAHGPLRGLRVLDLSALLPGPFATQVLADLGADVMKVEHPRGDDARGFPSGLHATANRNKRAVTADLKHDDQREACLTLAAEADVLVEGFRPGVADRLGVGYAAVRQRREDIIYCSISGYGQTGPERDRPGHDLTYLAAAGAMAYAAHWGDRPRRSGVPVGDLAASCYAVIAILVALRERDANGCGGHLDVAIADAAMAFASPRGGAGFTVTDEHRLGAYATNDVYFGSDAVPLAVSAVEPKFWNRLRGELALLEPELTDPRFDDEAGRRRHGDRLRSLLTAAFATRPAADWIERLHALDVPAEPLRTLAAAAGRPQAEARGVVATCDGERQIMFPVLRDGAPMASFRSTAPALGESDAAAWGASGVAAG